MKKETEPAMFPPEIYQWMDEKKLRIENTGKEFGYVASPQWGINRYFLFTPENKMRELARLNEQYGLHLDDTIFNVRTPEKYGSKTLEEMSQEAIVSRIIRKDKEHLSMRDEPPWVLIVGITIPDRKYFYIEHDCTAEGDSVPLDKQTTKRFNTCLPIK